MSQHLHLNATNSFTIELSDGVKQVNYSGELFSFDAHQVEHIVLSKPENGRHKIEVFKSTVPNVNLDIHPPIQIRNVFPFEIYLSLEGQHASHFKLTNTRIKPVGVINFVPHDVGISLRDWLDNSTEIMYSTRVHLQIRMTTNNSYLNKLLESVGLIKIRVEIRNQNKYEPQIVEVSQ
jgi:hypothetical protein